MPGRTPRKAPKIAKKTAAARSGPVPPGGTGKDARWIDVREDDEARMAKLDPASRRPAGLGRVLSGHGKPTATLRPHSS